MLMRNLFILAALAAITLSGCKKDEMKPIPSDCGCIFFDKQTQEERTFVYVTVDRAFKRFDVCSKVPFPVEVTNQYEILCP
jgi:outer membrane lipoprotein SlyB